MTTPPDQSETVAFLTGLAGAPPVQTHISFVFLGPDQVWKLKKSVRLPFLDFTGIEARHRFCARELALNAPAARGLYRDIVPVTRAGDGTLSLNGTGDIVDWVVRMARVPAGDFLDARIGANGLPPPMLDAIADAVAAHHLSLPAIPDLVPGMMAIADGNVRSAHAAGLPPDRVRAWQEAMRTGLDARRDWMNARARDGFIRRCHGDLHLGNLCLWQGRPTLFDALEFDEALARIDTAYDLAFLLMDLEHRLDRAAANRVLNRYVARTGDANLVHGLPVFLSMRAMIKAHVAATQGRAAEGLEYLESAEACLAPRPPVVAAVGGLPGTGKSTLARALAPHLGPAPGALVPRSDEIRKRQHGTAPEQRLPPTAYTPDKSAAVFQTLTDEAETAAHGGHAVIVDATFLSLDHRAAIEQAAVRAGVPFVGIWLTAPHDLLEQRIAARTGDASDATAAVLHAAIPNDPGPGGWHAVSAVDGAAALALVKDLLRSYIVF